MSIQEQQEHPVSPLRSTTRIQDVLTRFLFGNTIAWVVAIVVTASVIFVGVTGWQHTTQGAFAPTSYVPVSVPVEEVVQKPSVENPFSQVQVVGRAAVVYDVYERKTLYAKSADTRLPLASLTKLMTSLVAVTTLDTEAPVAITQNALDTEGDSGLFANELWRLKDLVSFTMLTSSNDGADALAAAVGATWQSAHSTAPYDEYGKVEAFVQKMNAQADTVGLTATHFSNPTGLDEPTGGPGAVGTASDVAKLLSYIWKEAPDAIAYTDEELRYFTSLDGFTHEAENTNQHVSAIPGVLASKTGFTDLAGGNLAILYNSGLDHPVVVVVLGSTKEGRFSDVQTLVDATTQYIESGWYQFEVAGSTERG